MSHSFARRQFLANVGRGALVAAIGPAVAFELGLTPKNAFAEDVQESLHFGPLEPLVCELQETPLARLQPLLVEKARQGISVKTLVGAAALANARTFGGEDYIGFHTFMALAPAYRMSNLMPKGAELLPVLKVLYRNTKRIQEVGGRSHEVLHRLPQPSSAQELDGSLYKLVRAKETARAEQVFAALVAKDPQSGLDAILPSVQDNPEVHRTVLPFRAWDMVDIVGVEHALTLLRQSLRYCLTAYQPEKTEMSEQANMMVRLFDEFKLHGKSVGDRTMDSAYFEQLAQTFSSASPNDAAKAVATALAEGFSPNEIGEAISLSASLMVLRDGGRLPQNEDKLKPPGCVHGDSVGVHASDAANAWRNLAKVSTGRNQFTCLIIGAWQVARDRSLSPNLMSEALPSKYHLSHIPETDAEALLAQLDEAIRFNLQGHATAIVQRYGESSHSPDRLFDMCVRYAVSEDGALHAEKYFQTVWNDFHATRPSARWRHMMSLARVTASEFGSPAAGQAEARDLLGLQS